MATTVSPIFARNTLPNLSITNDPSKPTTTPSGVNPFRSINPTVDTSNISNTATEGANSLNPMISGLTTMANTTFNVSGAPNTSRQTSISRVLDASKGITSGDVANISSMRPENKYESRLGTALDNLADYSSGNSKVDRTLAKQYLGRLDAAGAASSMAQSMRVANNPYLTTGAKQAAAFENQRATASERSKVAGELAAKAQERAYSATKDYADLSMDAMKFEEDKFKTDLGAATEQAKMKLDGAISAGNLESAEIQDNLSIWNTTIQTGIQDLTRRTNAMVAAGTMTSDQARMALDGAISEVQASQTNINNSLNQARGIMEYEKQQSDLSNDEVDRQYKQKQIDALDSTIINQNIENQKMYHSISTDALLSYRERFQGQPQDNITDALNDPAIRQALKNEWDAIPGKTEPPSFETWAAAAYNSIVTSSESAVNTMKAKKQVLKKQWVGDGPGQMSEDAFEAFMKPIELAASLGGMVENSPDGKIVYLVGADGKPKINPVSGKQYAWSMEDGSPTTITNNIGGTKEDFDKFYSTLSSGDIPEGVTESTVRDVYDKLIKDGKTPDRYNIKEALASSETNNTDLSNARYDKISNKLSDSVAEAGKITSPSLTTKYMNDMVLEKTEVRDLLEYERANPDKSNYISDGDLVDLVDIGSWTGNTRPTPTSKHLNGAVSAIDEILTEKQGKFFKIGGKDVVVLGLADTGTRSWKIYDVDSGETETWTSGDFYNAFKNNKQ